MKLNSVDVQLVAISCFSFVELSVYSTLYSSFFFYPVLDVFFLSYYPLNAADPRNTAISTVTVWLVLDQL